MSNELISVIVPIYNCEQYLEECIDSIIRQTYKNLEIILVDDGSTDLSGEICDRCAKKDYRVKVVHQKNSGSQAARSTGIENANGKFIGFVDSDDWIDENMYEVLYQYIGSSDLVTSGLWIYDLNGRKNKYLDLFNPGKYDTHSKFFCDNLIISSQYESGGMFGGILNNVICKLYKTSIVKQCYQMVNVDVRNGEDLLFVLAYIFNCNEITVTNECHYHYRYNASSVSHSFNRNYLAEMNRFYDVLDKAISGHVMESILRDQLKRLVMYFVYAYAGSMLQMGADVCYPQYLFPCKYLLEGKSVVLFGAGKVGQSYYYNWKYDRRINVVMWVDNMLPHDEVLKVKVLIPEKCISIDFDYVICAVNCQKLAEEMKKQLIGYGVVEDKILWEKPIDIFKEHFLKR